MIDDMLFVVLIAGIGLGFAYLHGALRSRRSTRLAGRGD